MALAPRSSTTDRLGHRRPRRPLDRKRPRLLPLPVTLPLRSSGLSQGPQW